MADPSRDELINWCEQILAVGRGVTKWEKEFIESRLQALDYGSRLSEAQVQKIEEIYAERTPL